MYKNLEAEFRRKDITRADVASALGINIATVSNKLNKPGRLKLGEAQAIKSAFFPDLTIEYLFEA